MENGHQSDSRGSSEPSIDSLDDPLSDDAFDQDSSINKDFSTDEPTFKNQLDLLNGVATRLVTSGRLKQVILDDKKDSFIEVDKSNLQILHNYTWDLVGVTRLLICVLFDFDTLLLLTVIVCCAISKYTLKVDFAWPAILLIFQIVVRITIELIVDSRKKKAAYQFNYSIVKKFFKTRFQTSLLPLKKDAQSQSSSFAYDLWQNLKIADIIILKSGQEFPADCLILDYQFLMQSEKKRNVVEGLADTANSFVQTQKENILVQHISTSQARIQTKVCFKGSYQKSRNEGQTKVSNLSVAQLMSGTLIWEWNYHGFFVGQFKFADNSGSFDINSDCVIRRGSTLVSNHKLVCLVLNVGRTCQGSLTRKRRFALTKNYIVKSIRNFFQYNKTQETERVMTQSRWMIVLMFLFYVIMMFIRMTNTITYNFGIQFLASDTGSLKQEYSQQSNLDALSFVLSFVSNAAVAGPLLFRLTFDIITLFQAYFVEQDIQLTPSQLTFNNLKVMQKLPFVGHVITSPATLEQSQIYKVTYFQIANTNFFSNDYEQATAEKDQLSQIATNQVTDEKSIDSISDTSKDDFLHSDYLPHMRHLTDFYFVSPEATQLQSNKFNKLHDPFLSFLKTICVCHQAVRNQGENELSTYFTSYYPEEEAQLMFALQYNCLYSQRKGPVMTIHTNGKLERLDELVYFQMQLQDKHSSVFVQILRPFNANGNLIINIKGSVAAVIDFCNTPSNAAKLHTIEASERLAQMGYFLQAYCTKELSQEDSKYLREKLEGLSVYSKTFQQQLKDICLEHLYNIDLVGTLGFQKTVPLRNTMAMQDFMNNSIKVWILSQQKTKKTMIDCANLNLIDDMVTLSIRGKNQREIEEKLRSTLNNVFDIEAKHKLLTTRRSEMLAKQIVMQTNSWREKILLGFKSFFVQKQMPHQLVDRQKRCLTFDSEALLIILRNENLLRVFLALCMFCDLMVGSDISPELKGRLSKELVEFEKFGRDQNRRYILGIIGAPEDSYLIEKCVTDVVVCAQNQMNQRSIQSDADISLVNLYGLTYLLMKHGSQLHRRLVTAGRFHLKRQLFFVILLICFYFVNCWSEAVQFFDMQFGVYMCLVFTVLVVSSSVLHQTDAFKDLHRVNGQYLCNSEYSILGPRQLIFFLSDSFFDIITLLAIAGPYHTSMQTITPQNGFVPDSRYQGLMVTIVIILQFITQFIKLPLISKPNFLFFLFGTVIMIMTVFYEDPDLIGFQSLVHTPQIILQIILLVAFQLLKLIFKWILRHHIPALARWDNYNLYVEERIELEKFESEQQLQQISFDNIAHQNSIIDIFQLHLLHIAELINKNLLRMTYRNDLAIIIFDQIGYIKSIKTMETEEAKKESLRGLGPQYLLVYNESNIQINKNTLKFKLKHIEQDYQKKSIASYKNDKQGQQHTMRQVLTMCIMYLVVFVFGLQQYLVKQKQYSSFIFYMIQSICCLFAYALIKYDQILRMDRVTLCLQLCLHGLNVAQIELEIQQIDELHALIITLILWSMFTRNSHSFITVILCVFTTVYYASRSGQLEQVTIFKLINSLGVPFACLICLIYVYWDEFFVKSGFLVMDRRIKEYKKMRLGAQKLVSEIVRKSQNKADIEINKQLVVIVVKLSNYTQLVCSGQSNDTVYNLMSAINVGLERLTLRHSLLKINSIEDCIQIVGGMKLYEQTQHQKIQSVSAVQRGCRFAFDTFALANQLQKQFKQQIQFQVGIHCPDNIASGVMGNINTSMVLVGRGLQKADQIVNRAAPQQVCISKECYESLNRLNKSHNIKIKEQIRIENANENIYELIDMKKKVSQIQKTLIQNLQQKMHIENDPQVDAIESSLNTVSQIESDMSGQLQGSTFLRDITKESVIEADFERTFKEFKDDQEIANNTDLNQVYKLVLRSRIWFNFKHSEEEDKLSWQINFEYKSVSVIFATILTFIIFVYAYQCICIAVDSPFTFDQLLWLILYFAVNGIITFFELSLKFVKVTKWIHLAEVLIILGFAVSIVVTQKDANIHKASTMITLVTSIILFTQRGQRFQDIFLLVLLINLTWIATTIGVFYADKTYLQIVKQCLGQAGLTVIIIFESLRRDQVKRQDFNMHQMLTVEGQKNKQLTTKIMPVQALNALQQEESFVQTLKNGSMLMFSLVNFQDFVNSKEIVNKPQLAFKLLDQLFIKFDELVEAYGLFRLHTDSQNYIVVSDPSVILQANSEDYQVQQALKLVLCAQAMIKVVSEACAHMIATSTEISSTSTLMRIGSQIGIHSGNAVCCIIGQKLKEFKIFGKMPQVCKNARNSAPKDQVCITKETRDLLKQHTDSSINLVFTENLSIIKEGQRGSFQTYIVVAEQQEVQKSEETIQSYDSQQQSNSATNQNEEHSNTNEDQSVSGRSSITD